MADTVVVTPPTLSVLNTHRNVLTETPASGAQAAAILFNDAACASQSKAPSTKITAGGPSEHENPPTNGVVVVVDDVVVDDVVVDDVVVDDVVVEEVGVVVPDVVTVVVGVVV